MVDNGLYRCYMMFYIDVGNVLYRWLGKFIMILVLVEVEIFF